jgi:hypothetical protein
MPVVGVDFELAAREAEKALKSAQTAGDVRNIWRKYSGSLGHRTLGRMLLGKTAAELIAKREASSEPE